MRGLLEKLNRADALLSEVGRALSGQDAKVETALAARAAKSLWMLRARLEMSAGTAQAMDVKLIAARLHPTEAWVQERLESLIDLPVWFTEDEFGALHMIFPKAIEQELAGMARYHGFNLRAARTENLCAVRLGGQAELDAANALNDGGRAWTVSDADGQAFLVYIPIYAKKVEEELREGWGAAAGDRIADRMA